MKAAVVQSPQGPLVWMEVARLPLRPHEVRVRVRAASINPVDWKMKEGQGSPLGALQRLLGPGGPWVLGIDFSGDVVEVGSQIHDLSLGDRVVGGANFAFGQRGSFAEEVCVRPSQCARLQPNVSYEQAACLPVAGVTPWMALTEHCRIGPGHRVLLLGASGGVGLFGIQLTRMLGAQAVGVCSTPNVALVESLGATAIDYTQGDALQAAAAHGPYHLILHTAGTEAYPLKRCMDLLATGGTLELVAIQPQDYMAFAASALLAPFQGKRAKRVKTLLGRPTRERLEPLVSAMAQGQLKAVIAERFPLSDVDRALQISKRGKVVGKLVLVP